MYLDKQNLFSEDQAVTVTAVSTNVIDLGANASEIQTLFEKGLVEVLAQVTTAFADGTSLKVTLQTDSDEAFGTVATVHETAAVAVASLVAGYKFRLGVLPVGIKRYLRLNYTVVGTMSAGKILAGLVLNAQSNGA